ncbi:MAG: hypothetical protein WA860_02050, partial [Acidimicrobiales bacterium]
MSGVCIGALGTVGTGVSTDLNPWLLVLIAIAAVIIGAFAPWTVVYLFGCLTASGRDLRDRLAVVEARLDDVTAK